MTLKSLFPITQQFQNKNGSILTGGKVYIYYQGRTALATTYHDEEGTVVNPNPVLLDNNGRATVFADTIYSYTIVVCDYYGKELFSQDITLHDAISTAKDVMVMGSNGSVKVDTTTLPNGVQYDLSVNTDIIATKESVANKKDKQNELNFNGSATKTVKSITQNANGELNVEFADIDLPQEVPNVDITSKDSSVNITSSVDAGTNAKTFDLSVDSITNIASSDGSINVSTSEGVTDLTLPSDVVRDSAYTHIDAATANPLMDGTAAVGVSTKYAREDHVHPTDTSREAIANKTTVVLGTSDSKYPTDKAVAEFVNSSIATNTANYISNNGEPFTSVEQLEAYSGPVTNNDYAFVTGIDSEGNTYYDRYKATVSGETVTWALEYRLNNSSFTAAQWSAINSGITSALVAKIHTHSNKDVLDGITSSDVANWNSKMDRQTVGNVSEPVYLENGIAKVATNVATKMETEEAISNSVDQAYSPTSTKAQSGVAVNEAFKTRETSTSDKSYTYLGMNKNYGGKEELYWKLVSFNTANYWTLQFEIDVSNGRKSNSSYDTEIYETKRLTICGKTPGSVAYSLELRYAAQGVDSSRGYDNNIYYEIGSDNLVTVYIKAIDRPNKTQICRLKDVINFQGISNITWYEPVNDAGTQPTNPVQFKEVFPSIASPSSNIGSDSVPVYVNRGKPVPCNSSSLKAGKDDDGNVIKNTYQKKVIAGDNITVDGNTISSDQVFVATYGKTKFAEVKAAYEAGKICTVFKDTRYYYITEISTNRIRFAVPTPDPNIFSLTLTDADKWTAYNPWLQTHLTFDSAPTAGSNNPVTSDGIKTALDSRIPAPTSTTGTQVLKCINGVVQWVTE